MSNRGFACVGLCVCLGFVGMARADSAPPTAKELEQMWTDLAKGETTEDAARAYKAVVALAAAPKEAVAYLKGQVKPIPKLDAERVKQSIADLDSQNFAARQRAETELEAWNEVAEPALKAALNSKPTLEVRQRLEKLLAKLDHPVPSGEKLRTWRVIEALEMIGTAEARDILKQIAGGAPEASVTQEAKAAAARVSKHLGPTP